jgi:Leucine-rich repeat (LRR) protein
VPKGAPFERAVARCVKKQLLSINARTFRLQNLALPFLPNLKNLCITSSAPLSNLSGLTNCPSLRTLDLSGCGCLTHIAPISACAQLICLTLSACEALESLEGLEWCSALTRLCVSGCRALTNLHPLKGLQALQTLNAEGCYQLQDVSALESLTSLTSVTLHHCINLPHARFASQRLHTLNIVHCPMLQLDVSECANLQQLHANQSSWLTDLNDFPTNLTAALFSWCFSLTNVAAVNTWHNLQMLDLEDCTQLVRFDVGFDADSLPFLRELVLSGCSALQHAPFLSNLKALRELHMNGCVKLHAVDLSGCENLLVLDITARSFVDFPVLPTVNRITQIDWSFSDAVSLLPVMACTQLDTLLLEGCLVTDFTPLHSCPLKNLDVSRNWQLTSLSSLEACKKLSKVTAALCPSLDLHTCAFLGDRLRRSS